MHQKKPLHLSAARDGQALGCCGWWYSAKAWGVGTVRMGGRPMSGGREVGRCFSVRIAGSVQKV